MKTLKKRSIRTNLVVLFLLILVPLFTIIIFSAFNQKQHAIANASDNAVRVAKNIGQQQKFVAENTRLLLEVLSETPDIRNGNYSKTKTILKRVMDLNPSYAAILLVDSTGDLLASGIGDKTINVSDRQYFKDVMLHKSFTVGQYSRSRLTNKMVLHYAYPVLNTNGSVNSILIASFDLNYYDVIFKNANLGNDAILKIEDRNGNLVYYYPKDDDRNIKVVNDIEGKELSSNKTSKFEGTFISTDSDNNKRLYGYCKIYLAENTPYMAIYVGVPFKQAVAGFSKALTSYAILLIISALIMVVIAYFFARLSIVKPIDKLVQIAGKIATGDLNTRTGITESKSELGKLAIAIDEMSDKLLAREGERKLADKNLKKLKERFELAINSANIGIFDWHIRNNTLVWDKNMVALYGIDRHHFDFTYEAWKELIHPEDMESFDAIVKESVESFSSFRSEFRIIHPFEGVKFIRIFGDIIPDKEGKPVRLIGVNWDITERKALETKLHEARDKAEMNDKLKSTFLANISHEIRTPLHGIIGFAQILKNNDISIQERLQFLDIIINSGNKLMNIISNIIDISLLDAGQIKLIEKECNLEESINELYNSYLHIKISENKSFEFVLEEKPSNLQVHIDILRFTQIFGNLIDNAFKFTEYGTVKIGCTYENNELLCFVKDTGIGIDVESIGRIFDRFKQLDDGYDRHYSGNGLGLSISRGIVDLMGGKIWAVGCEKGSEFYFKIPVKVSNTKKEVLNPSEKENLLN